MRAPHDKQTMERVKLVLGLKGGSGNVLKKTVLQIVPIEKRGLLMNEQQGFTLFVIIGAKWFVPRCDGRRKKEFGFVLFEKIENQRA